MDKETIDNYTVFPVALRYMNKWWKRFYKDNKAIVWAAIVSIILAAGILIKVPDEVTRFTLIMPIFAGFILFSILVTSDEELEDETNDEGKEKTESKPKPKIKKFSKK